MTMRQQSNRKVAFVVLAAAAVGTYLVACSSDSNQDNTGASPDSGTGSQGGGDATAVPDVSVASDAAGAAETGATPAEAGGGEGGADAGAPPMFALVHAAP